MGIWEFVVAFAAGAAVLGIAGTALARSGDRLGQETGLGGVVVGALLIAAVTSLPELVAISSAAVVGSPTLAVSAVLGSSMANMAILAMLDLLMRREAWAHVDPGQVRWGTTAIALTALTVLGIADPGLPRLGWVGIDTILIAAAYLAAVTWLARGSIGPGAVVARPPVRLRAATRPTLVRFTIATVGVLVSAPVVAWSAERIVANTELSEGLVGVALLAVATSLPELVTSISAARAGAHDLAVANLFGSNLFNVAILVVPDLLTVEGPLLRSTDSSQVVTGAAAIVLMAIALSAISTGQQSRLRQGQPDAALVLLLYALAVVLVGTGG